MASAAEPQGWHILPGITAFSMAKQAASRNALRARIDAASSTSDGSAVQTFEWWTINRSFAGTLMTIPTSAVQEIPVYCTRTAFAGTEETCYGPFPAKR